MPPAQRPPSKRSLKHAEAKRATRPLVDALAEAAWREADSALAEALIECERALAATDEDARQEALEVLSLALARAGRRRGLSRIGKRGAPEPFDPVRHELPASAKGSPKRVRVTMEGVARGHDVLIKALVAPVRAKRA